MIKRIKARIKAISVGDNVMLDTSKITGTEKYNRKFYPKDGTVGTVVGAIGDCPIVQWAEVPAEFSGRRLCPSHWLKRVK